MERINNLEITKSGNANGISLQLQKIIQDEGVERSLTQEEKQFIIEDATDAYGKFLDALGVDWRNDPNSADTPRRVAKKYINDIWKGRYEVLGEVTAFPSDGYSGIVLEKDIPLTSVCSHHHESILGKVHIAYIPGEGGKGIGLSKLNRVVEHFGRRGAIQEQLTMAVHNAIDKICEGNIGVMVMIQATHNCVCTRGVRHSGASMMTSHISGVFADHEKTAKQEVINMIRM